MSNLIFFRLPVSMYMDRENSNQARMSLNFFDFIVEPLFQGLKELLPKVEICLSNAFYNKQMWTMIEEVIIYLAVDM
jgi:hypothetical protein